MCLTYLSAVCINVFKLFACWVIVHAFFVVCLVLHVIHFFFFFFFKKYFRNTIKDSNSLDLNQVWRFVGPDLGPNRLQRSSADEKNRHKREKRKWNYQPYFPRFSFLQSRKIMDCQSFFFFFFFFFCFVFVFCCCCCFQHVGA